MCVKTVTQCCRGKVQIVLCMKRFPSLTNVCLLVLQVPAVRSRIVATVYVNIFHEKNLTSKHTKVVIEPPTFIHIVRTDKPIYKPGQTGRWSECGGVGGVVL